MIRMAQRKKWILAIVLALSVFLMPVTHSLAMQSNMEMENCSPITKCASCSVSISSFDQIGDSLMLSLDYIIHPYISSTFVISEPLYHPPK